MESSTLIPSPNDDTKEWSTTVRFAGDSGDGMQLTGGRLTFEAAVAGLGLSTFPDYPAEIRAPAGTTFGISSFQVRFGDGLIASSGDYANILVAMNPAALKENIKELITGGLLIVDKGSFNQRGLTKAGYSQNPLEDNSLLGIQILSPDISNLTLEAIKHLDLGNKDSLRCRNMWTLGLILWLFSRGTKKTSEWINNKFGKDNILSKANIAALKAGQAYAESTEISSDIIRREIPLTKSTPGTWRAITGGEAMALGLATGAKLAELKMTLCSYPITPASPIMHYLAAYRLENVSVFQAEDEIAACCAAIGASYAGGIGVTSSSGPGISLKTEAIGFAVSIEIPLVIINSQRAGPSTGMPTKAEQSDLLQAVYGRHGEAPLVVLAPKSPSDCFNIAHEAIRIATKFMTPVMILSDAYIANASEPWLIPDINSIEKFPVKFEAEKKDFLPFSRNPNTLSKKWIKPGTPGLEYRIGGLEKNSITGNISYDSDNHSEMTEIRAEKVLRVASDIEDLIINGPDKGEILLVGWGSTNGPISETQYKLFKEGVKISHIQLRCLWPMHKNVKKIISNFNNVVIIEMNDGQLYKLLRAEIKNKVYTINQISGKPFRITKLIDELKNFDLIGH